MFRVRQRADDGQVIRAGATERGPALEGVRVELLVTEAMGQIRGYFLQQVKVALMAFGGGAQVFVMEVEAGAQGMFPQSTGGNIAFGTDHCFQHGAVWCLRQLGDLPANALERQAAAGREAFDLGCTRQDHHRRAGQ